MATIFSKIVKGVLMGGGTVLSLFNPVLGGAAIALGGAINNKTGESGASQVVKTIDNVSSKVSESLDRVGLLNTPVVQSTATVTASAPGASWLPLLLLGGIGLLLIFKKRR